MSRQQLRPVPLRQPGDVAMPAPAEDPHARAACVLERATQRVGQLQDELAAERRHADGFVRELQAELETYRRVAGRPVWWHVAVDAVSVERACERARARLDCTIDAGDA